MKPNVKKNEINYILGLDIGTASCGWAVINLDKKRIEDFGTRTFPEPTIPKNKVTTNSFRRRKRLSRHVLKHKKERVRTIRSLLVQHRFLVHTPLEEQALRIGNMHLLRKKALDERISDIELCRLLLYFAKHRGFHPTKRGRSEFDVPDAVDEEEFEIDEELEKSEEKEDGTQTESTDQEKAEKGMLNATKVLEQMYDATKYRTYGEMLLDQIDKRFYPAYRNRKEEYTVTFKREWIRDEIVTIFKAQKSFGNEKITEEFEKKYLSALLFQRSFSKGDQILKMYNFCELNKMERCFSKNTVSNYSFLILQNITNLSFYSKSGYKEKTSKLVTDSNQEGIEKIQKLHDTMLQHILSVESDDKPKDRRFTYKWLRDYLQLDDTKLFSGINYKSEADALLAKEEKKKGDSGTNKIYNESEISHDLVSKIEAKKIFFDGNALFTFIKHIYPECKPMLDVLTKKHNTQTEFLSSPYVTILDELTYACSVYPDYETVSAYLRGNWYIKKNGGKCFSGYSYSDKLIDLVSEGTLSGSAPYSKFILNELSSYMYEHGVTYPEAKKALYPRSFISESDDDYYVGRQEYLPSLPLTKNPIVDRAVSQARKVVNEIITRYGSPCSIHIETTRSLTMNSKNKVKESKKNVKNAKLNQDARIAIEKANRKVSGELIEKYKLWVEQKEHCIYTGTKIELSDLFTSSYEIDHIIPMSRSNNDSYMNKVVVTQQANQEKGARFPFEYLHGADWIEFTNRVKECYPLVSAKSKHTSNVKFKSKFLLAEKLPEGFSNAQLTATSYIAKNFSRFIAKHLLFKGYPIKVQKLVLTNGKMTDSFRKFNTIVPIPKNREDVNHHALDAVITALITPSMIQQFSLSNQNLPPYNTMKNEEERLRKIFHNAFHPALQDSYESLIYEIIARFRPTKLYPVALSRRLDATAKDRDTHELTHYDDFVIHGQFIFKHWLHDELFMDAGKVRKLMIYFWHLNLSRQDRIAIKENRYQFDGYADLFFDELLESESIRITLKDDQKSKFRNQFVKDINDFLCKLPSDSQDQLIKESAKLFRNYFYDVPFGFPSLMENHKQVGQAHDETPLPLSIEKGTDKNKVIRNQLRYELKSLNLTEFHDMVGKEKGLDEDALKQAYLLYYMGDHQKDVRRFFSLLFDYAYFFNKNGTKNIFESLKNVKLMNVTEKTNEGFFFKQCLHDIIKQAKPIPERITVIRKGQRVTYQTETLWKEVYANLQDTTQSLGSRFKRLYHDFLTFLRAEELKKMPYLVRFKKLIPPDTKKTKKEDQKKTTNKKKTEKGDQKNNKKRVTQVEPVDTTYLNVHKKIVCLPKLNGEHRAMIEQRLVYRYLKGNVKSSDFYVTDYSTKSKKYTSLLGRCNFFADQNLSDQLPLVHASQSKIVRLGENGERFEHVLRLYENDLVLIKKKCNNTIKENKKDEYYEFFGYVQNFYDSAFSLKLKEKKAYVLKENDNFLTVNDKMSNISPGVIESITLFRISPTGRLRREKTTSLSKFE